MKFLNIMWVMYSFAALVPMGMDSMYQTMQVRTSSSWLAELVYRLFEEWWITFQSSRAAGHMTLIVGFKTSHDILFRNDLKLWKTNMDIILTVDCAEEDVACHVGLVTQYIPQIKLDNVQNTVAVVVGPPA